ncbi:MAG: isoaspartyl peptidase/L-asparaginase, partial [Oceanicaulis sp.]
MADIRPVFVLHGGAGVLAERSYEPDMAHMRQVAEVARAALCGGASALDAVCEAVRALEASGLFVAGKGASPNRAGRYELDAAIMDGSTRNAGAVSALEGYVSPVTAARRVLETTPHVLLAGAGAAHFAYEQDLEKVLDAPSYYTPAAAPDDRAIPTGTVGAV